MKELKVLMKRFLADKNRGISVELFADLAGVDHTYIEKVFIYEKVPLTEWMQIRVSKAYIAFTNGEVAVMANKDQTRYVEYRKQPKPRLARSTRIQVENGRIKLNIGIRNRLDYSTPDLDEQLRSPYGRHT